MSQKNRISVITVVKNNVHLIEETILSVIAKKATAEIDYIIIDGGSTDGTTDIIRKYSDNIWYWVSEPDNGIYDAMNKGWSVAGDNNFILFIGSGDRVISIPGNMSGYNKNDVIYGTVHMGKNKIFKPRSDFHLKIYNSLHHQALLVNKSFHPCPPFNSRYFTYADFDFNQRLKKNKANFLYSHDLIGYARPGGVSDRQCFVESLRIVLTNYGYFWVLIAILGYGAMKMIPFLKRLRPLIIERQKEI